MTLPGTLPTPASSLLHTPFPVHPSHGQRMAVQTVDSSIKMAFYGDGDPAPVSSLTEAAVYKSKLSCRVRCNCECAVREQVSK